MSRTVRHSVRIIGASVLYALSLVASAWVLRTASGLSQPVQLILALAPLIPGALMLWAHIRQIGDMDELMRKVQLNSLAIAAGGAAFLTIGYGSLEMTGFPKLSMFYVAPLIVVIWTVSNFAQVFWLMRGPSRT